MGIRPWQGERHIPLRLFSIAQPDTGDVVPEEPPGVNAVL